MRKTEVLIHVTHAFYSNLTPFRVGSDTSEQQGPCQERWPRIQHGARRRADARIGKSRRSNRHNLLCDKGLPHPPERTCRQATMLRGASHQETSVRRSAANSRSVALRRERKSSGVPRYEHIGLNPVVVAENVPRNSQVRRRLQLSMKCLRADRHDRLLKQREKKIFFSLGNQGRNDLCHADILRILDMQRHQRALYWRHRLPRAAIETAQWRARGGCATHQATGSMAPNASSEVSAPGRRRFSSSGPSSTTVSVVAVSPPGEKSCTSF